MEKSIVLIGGLTNGNPETKGTGILIQYNSENFIITCRHVIFEAGLRNLFAIPNPKKTKSPKGEYKILNISKIHTHPKDTNNENFDIVICELIENKEELSSHNLSFIHISRNMKILPIKEGDEIKSYGFPVEYSEKLLAMNVEENLSPFISKSTVLDIPILQLNQTGFIGNLKEAFFSQTINNNVIGKGNSGGLLTISSNSVEVPYGIVLGSAEYTYNQKQIKGIVFAKFERVLEILESL